jgi:two-component system, OmpR family, sensor histidine kinase BaeS
VVTDYVLLRFEDSAPGVSHDNLQHLFDRFYRVDPSRSRAFGGAGLGLAICERIIAAHGGTIRAMPSPLGGVCMEVRLRCAHNCVSVSTGAPRTT